MSPSSKCMFTCAQAGSVFKPFFSNSNLPISPLSYSSQNLSQLSKPFPFSFQKKFIETYCETS